MNLTTFQDLPDNARVWIYQSDRAMNDQEIINIRSRLDQFIQSWSAHGAKVEAAGDVLLNHFVVLMADEESVRVSGCSIDSSVHFMQQVGSELQIDFFQRMNIPLLINGIVKLYSIEDLRTALDNGELDTSSITFNNLISSKKELINGWNLRLKDSFWMKMLQNPIEKTSL